MRREELYLRDIVEAADAIAGFLVGVVRAAFLVDDLLRSAVLQKLTIIGEAAARLPGPFKESHPAVEWPDVVAFRNLAVHAYFAIDWTIVWTTAVEDAPRIRTAVVEILEAEFPAPPPNGPAPA
jgi:uncharacterized protein with HEPN domain